MYEEIVSRLCVKTRRLKRHQVTFEPPKGEGDALQAVAVTVQGTVVDLDMDVVLSATKLSIDLKLPMAASIMLATSQR